MIRAGHLAASAIALVCLLPVDGSAQAGRAAVVVQGTGSDDPAVRELAASVLSQRYALAEASEVSAARDFARLTDDLDGDSASELARQLDLSLIYVVSLRAGPERSVYVQVARHGGETRPPVFRQVSRADLGDTLQAVITQIEGMPGSVSPVSPVSPPTATVPPLPLPSSAAVPVAVAPIGPFAPARGEQSDASALGLIFMLSGVVVFLPGYLLTPLLGGDMCGCESHILFGFIPFAGPFINGANSPPGADNLEVFYTIMGVLELAGLASATLGVVFLLSEIGEPSPGRAAFVPYVAPMANGVEVGVGGRF